MRGVSDTPRLWAVKAAVLLDLGAEWYDGGIFVRLLEYTVLEDAPRPYSASHGSCQELPRSFGSVSAAAWALHVLSSGLHSRGVISSVASSSLWVSQD